MYVKQDEFINIVIEHNGDLTAITKYLNETYGTHHTTAEVRRRIGNYVRKGLLPLESGNYVGVSETLKGVTTHYDDEGNVIQQWVKTDAAKDKQLEAFKHAVDNIVSIVEPIKPVPLNTKEYDNDLLVKIPIADAHIGLYTWYKEVGVTHTKEDAKDLYIKGMSNIIQNVPDAGTCLLLDLGDTIHVDDQSNQTKSSKHQLDVDGRYDELFDMALFITCAMIDIALTKFPKVIYRKTRGNHDPDSSIALSAAIEMRYKDEPRVTIERSPNLFWYYVFGKTLHFSTHGHTVRQQKRLPEIVAHDCKKVWSECDYVYIDTGHVHHQRILETPTAICESHNTLAAGDAFNYGHGYRALRNLKAIWYHKNHGEIGRHVVPYSVLQ